MNVVATDDTFEESGVLTQENLTFLALDIYVVALQAWSRMCLETPLCAGCRATLHAYSLQSDACRLVAELTRSER